jgi:dihydropteroate synthase
MKVTTNSTLTLTINGRTTHYNRPLIMGILNVTPDSFFDGGQHFSVTQAIQQCEKMIAEGADIIDIGGQSTRPNSERISATEELKRITPVLESIVNHFSDTLISIDTYHSVVAKSAVQMGAHIINDISAGEDDPLMTETVAQLNVPYIIMHKKGTVETMHSSSSYNNVVDEVKKHLQQKVIELNQLGINQIIIDPGFGFSKSKSENFDLLNHLDEFKSIGAPILVGISRKSMIYKTLQINPEDSLNGTTVLNTIALLKGANILRVHDVKACKETIQLVQYFNQ